MNPITLPMTIPDLRVEGAPVLVTKPDGQTASGTYLDSHEMRADLCLVFSEGLFRYVDWEFVALDLHHPNGERIAQLVATGPCPDADRETLAAIRDVVLAMVPA